MPISEVDEVPMRSPMQTLSDLWDDASFAANTLHGRILGKSRRCKEDVIAIEALKKPLLAMRELIREMWIREIAERGSSSTVVLGKISEGPPRDDAFSVQS